MCTDIDYFDDTYFYIKDTPFPNFVIYPSTSKGFIQIRLNGDDTLSYCVSKEKYLSGWSAYYYGRRITRHTDSAPGTMLTEGSVETSLREILSEGYMAYPEKKFTAMDHELAEKCVSEIVGYLKLSGIDDPIWICECKHVPPYGHSNSFEPRIQSREKKRLFFEMGGRYYIVTSEKIAEMGTMEMNSSGKAYEFKNVIQLPVYGLVYEGVVSYPRLRRFTEVDEGAAENFMKIMKECFPMRSPHYVVWMHEIEFLSQKKLEARVRGYW
ncbi:hypothetical protein [Methanorbis rubei]|uniref:Uncharacterized protein n=1 Tax=Methanorbis rubei TaxID=3028300 RepID=A0AAE4MFP0_9EURY|nr:hypothetical protein [Methanocorpusculaceae archaeon Cs1]